MIIGLGTDLVEIARIADALERHGERFCRRILRPEEVSAMNGTARPAHYLARRWAAKEAAAKALGSGIAHGVSWQDFLVEHDPAGAPVLVLSGQAGVLASGRGVDRVLLSISDERAYALAFVVLECCSN